MDGGTLFVTALFSFFAEEKKAAAVLRYQEKIFVVSRIKKKVVKSVHRWCVWPPPPSQLKKAWIPTLRRPRAGRQGSTPTVSLPVWINIAISFLHFILHGQNDWYLPWRQQIIDTSLEGVIDLPSRQINEVLPTWPPLIFDCLQHSYHHFIRTQLWSNTREMELKSWPNLCCSARGRWKPCCHRSRRLQRECLLCQRCR